MDIDAMNEHAKSLMLAGEMGHSGYVFEDVYEEQVVCVGSHTEDQGHYETETYVGPEPKHGLPPWISSAVRRRASMRHASTAMAPTIRSAWCI